MRVAMDTRRFTKEMNNLINYSYGFLDGIERAKPELYASLAPEIIEFAYQYVDANARVTPQLLHHMYEWYETGSPKARLFDLDFKINKRGITFDAKMKQSKTIKNGSRVPFYNKAEIMERGVAVRIEPRRAEALAFEIDGETIFTKSGVTVSNPGGPTKGQFEKVIDTFFGVYFKQSFLRVSGLSEHFKNAKVFKTGLASGKSRGRSAGLAVGYKWVATAGVKR